MQLMLLAAVEGAAQEEAAGIAALGIDPLAILAQSITFLVLLYIIKKFALGKIIDTLEARRKTIDDGVRLGLKMEAEQAKLDEKIDAQLKQTRTEADKIIAQANNEAGEILRSAQESATRKLDAMMSDARARIDEEMNKAQKALKSEVIDMVTDATEIILEEKLDQSKDSILIERALKGVRQ
jgi:F-type H+-transporting ATPase subunit b